MANNHVPSTSAAKAEELCSRNVWQRPLQVHVVPWGLYAPAKVVGAQSVDYGDAEVYPIVELVNKFQDQKAIRIACSIRSLDGQLITHQD